MSDSILEQFPEFQKALDRYAALPSFKMGTTSYWCIAFTGSRKWKDKPLVDAVIRACRAKAAQKKFTLLVFHGACDSGLDKIVYNVCDAHGIFQPNLPAPWKIGSKAAGNARNEVMIDLFMQLGGNLVLAFPTEESTGTVHCMKYAQDNSLPVVNFGTLPH
jgi:hypothetical protein